MAVRPNIVGIDSPEAISRWVWLSVVRAPMAVGLVKSNGVPATGLSSPVGMRPESTGVNLEACSVRM